MSMFRDLRERRVPQFVSAYVVAGWGLVQFVTFLEGRLMFSPHLVNAFALSLLLLLPSVVLLSWCHGRPGRDRWGRAEKVSVPVNLAATIVLLLVVFADKDLGAVTQTVSVEDENGVVTERVIPKNEYRRRALLGYLENRGPAQDDWLRPGLAAALAVDLNQDPFLDLEYPPTRITALRREGYVDGLDVPRPLLRKIAREAHCSHLLTGWYKQDDAGLTMEIEIHSVDNGRRVSTLTFASDDIFTLVDEASRDLRAAIGVPAAHIEEQEDLPVADVLTADIAALRAFIDGMVRVVHDNDWQGALAPLDEAVARDPSFALAHFLGYVVRMSNGDEPGANASMALAMDNLYRLAERSQFQVKAIYYLNVKQDADKAMAVAEMWTRIYPNDVAAYQQTAMFAGLRNDYPTVIRALETILEIDPAQHQVLVQLAAHHQEQGDLEAAEQRLLQYADLNPNEALSYEQLSDLYMEFGRLDSARQALEQAQVVAPDRPRTLRSLAAIEAHQGRFDEAEASLLALRDGADNDEDRLSTVGELMNLDRTRGRWRRARTHLDQFNDLALTMANPTQVWLGHGLRLYRITVPARADSVYQEIHALRPVIGAPNDGLLGMCEAAILTKLGRLDEAEAGLAETELLMETYQLEVLRPRVMTVSGLVAEARGDLEAALAIHTEGLALDPTSNLHLRRVGHLQRLTGRTKEAHQTLARALELSPSQPDANLEMALLLHDEGRADQARPFLDRALAAWDQADAGHPGAAEAHELAARMDRTP